MLTLMGAGVPSNPEVFVRPNGEVYVVEGADILPLPEDPMAVEADAAKCDRLQARILGPPAIFTGPCCMPASSLCCWVVWICRLRGQTCGQVLPGELLNITDMTSTIES